jgi:hypothetical protein
VTATSRPSGPSKPTLITDERGEDRRAGLGKEGVDVLDAVIERAAPACGNRAVGMGDDVRAVLGVALHRQAEAPRLAEILAQFGAGQGIGHQPECIRIVDRRDHEARIDDDVARVGRELRDRIGGDAARLETRPVLDAHGGGLHLGLGARLGLGCAVLLQPHAERRAGQPTVGRHVDHIDAGIGEAGAVLGAVLLEGEVAAGLREAEDCMLGEVPGACRRRERGGCRCRQAQGYCFQHRIPRAASAIARIAAMLAS